MRIVVLHNDVPDSAPPDEKDALLQAEAVSAALLNSGHEAIKVPFPLDIRRVIDELRPLRPALVFNLVESIEGQGRLIYLAPTVLDYLALPYTGSPTEALFLTSHKLAAKRRLKEAGMHTPPWYSMHDASTGVSIPEGSFIIKSVWEHASIGLEDDSIIRTTDIRKLQLELENQKGKLGGEAFAEKYIEGREFNLSLLGKRGDVEVLPPAEIVFKDFPAGKPRIVGYRAKWDHGAFEYHNTPRSFNFPEGDRLLLETLKAISRSCWGLFGLWGYARVDFRVDQEGIPWVLEINANPCLAPDSGFVAAAEKHGLTYTELIVGIVEEALWRKKKNLP
ncbi:MAG: ATP-grasp domain-containing protein [Deltaproteobacteria bacterium]|nr:ATP-grasp domain-containing protein [Deltaproteobacteria bacterium]